MGRTRGVVGRTISCLVLVAMLMLGQVSPSLAQGSIVSDRAPATRRGERFGSFGPPFKVVNNLSYVANPLSQSQKLDLYLPADRPREPRPLIVWIHGGGWRGGDKKSGPFNEAVRKGFAVASVNYRLSQEAIFPAQEDDCVAAIDWLVKNSSKYNFDGKRIGLWGASAGGHLVALVGLKLATSANGSTSGSLLDKPDRPSSNVSSGASSRAASPVKAVCDWYGPTDLPRYMRSRDAGAEGLATIDQFLGGPNRFALAAKASPVNYVSKNAPPFLILHGKNDLLVPLSQSAALQKRLQELGIECELNVVNGGQGPGFGRKQVLDSIGFFERHLKGG